MSGLTTALPPGSTCATSSDAACQALRDTYGSPDFKGLDAQPGGETFFGALGRWISDALDYLFSHLGTGPSVLLLLAVVGAIVFYVVRRARASAGRSVLRGAAVAVETPLSDDPDREWKAALAAAAVADYREAIRRAFRSALLDVARRGRLPVDTSWTTRELMRAAVGDADLIAALAPAADSFDVAWYSGRVVDADAWELARSRCATVRALASRPHLVARVR